MLNPDAVAEYEAWKENKLTTEQDLSVRAFNTEMESSAVAWDEGAKFGSDPAHSLYTESNVKESNPYRQPGMRAELK